MTTWKSAPGTVTTAFITERCAANSGAPANLDQLGKLVDRDLVSFCENCTDHDPIYHLEPGTSWFQVNRAARQSTPSKLRRLPKEICGR